MKISKSKQELARIISENGGWRDGEFYVMCGDGKTLNSTSKPYYDEKHGWCCQGGFGDNRFVSGIVAKNWCHTILSRAEYLHLYPAPDADGWIEFDGAERPSGYFNKMIDVKLQDGRELTDSSGRFEWDTDGQSRIIAYRPHKPEPEFCESVMRSIPNPEAKPTIEQLAADYREAKDCADRKQQEADAAKADADAKLKSLDLAGEALGLLVSPITAKQEPELAITDWRYLRVGDEVECLSVNNHGAKYADERIGSVGRVIAAEEPGLSGQAVKVEFDGGECYWISEWRFISRP